MVDFAGWEMPLQYSDGVLKSHHHTREKASLFDVSHMVQTKWSGKDCTKFLESLVVADLTTLPVGHSTLSVFTNEKGGIIDDTVINKKTEDSFYVVSNAGCAEKDLAHIRAQLEKFNSNGGECNVTVINESLVALQGPLAVKVIEQLSKSDLSNFAFMTSRTMNLEGIKAYVSRCGYTGEDGFEIAVAHNEAEKLCRLILRDENVLLAGLAARDSLRLEAGLCLYGHDLDETISPVEAALTWTIGKNRRLHGGFLGADIILPQIKQGVSKRRVGLLIEGAPAREHAKVFADGQEIGHVTSGCPSPTLKKNIAMAYVKSGYHKLGTGLQVMVRNKMINASVVKMPFVPAK
jgi:aminomethyltransferase